MESASVTFNLFNFQLKCKTVVLLGRRDLKSVIYWWFNFLNYFYYSKEVVFMLCNKYDKYFNMSDFVFLCYDLLCFYILSLEKVVLCLKTQWTYSIWNPRIENCIFLISSALLTVNYLTNEWTNNIFFTVCTYFRTIFLF